jgi:hypothetical protein
MRADPMSFVKLPTLRQDPERNLTSTGRAAGEPHGRHGGDRRADAGEDVTGRNDPIGSCPDDVGYDAVNDDQPGVLCILLNMKKKNTAR